LHQAPPYFSMGETIMNDLGAVGIKLRMRPTERAAYISALLAKKLRGVCVCANAIYGNAASRMSEHVPSTGAYAYGGYPDIDALFKEQALVTDPRKRGAAPPDPADGPRAGEIRADLGVRLAERRGAAGGGARPDADQSLSLVGATRGGTAQEAVRPRGRCRVRV
jgi:hypothetical protein